MSFFQRTVLFIILPVFITICLMTFIQFRSMSRLHQLYQPNKVIAILKNTQNVLSGEYNRRVQKNQSVGDIKALSDSINKRLLAFEEIDILNQEIKLLTTVNSSIIPFVLVIMVLVGIIYLARNFFKPIQILTKSIQLYTMKSENLFPLPVYGSPESKLLMKTTNHFVETIHQQNKQISVQAKYLGWRNAALEIAHEIKNILVPAKLSSETVLETALDTQDLTLKENINRVIQSLSIFEKMSKSMKDLSTMRIPEITGFDLYGVVNEAVTFFQKLFKNIVLHGESVMISADPVLIRSVLDNIIINAIEALPTVREGKITINLINSNPPIFECIDNGSGIDETIKDKIFKLNFTTKKMGSGFGLYFVKKVVDDHGYTVECLSDKGENKTTVRVVFCG